MASELAIERREFLSTLPARRGERRLALAVMLVSCAIFLTAAPFARVPLAQVWAFIPSYESALAINDLITAVLLFGQFSFLRSRALCALASGYLFTAFMAVAHALTFPGLFSPTGLLGAGPQSTAWLYMFWHGGFPLLVVTYALLKDEGRETNAPRGRARLAILSNVAAVLVVVCGLTLLATAGQGSLPAIMQGNHYTPAMITTVSSVWGLSILALAVLWWRRPHTVLDLWLMVVMCAWLFDVALAAVLNAGRFDLGFYAGRIYGLLAASFVLMVLLIENSMLYARLVEAYESERRERQHVQERTTELTAVNKELDAFSYAVSHDLRAPLRSIDGFSQALLEDYADRLDAEGKGYLQRVRAATLRMGDLIDALLTLSRMTRREVRRTTVGLSALARAVADELKQREPERHAEFVIADGLVAEADPRLVRTVLENLLGNAWKFTSTRASARIEFGTIANCQFPVCDLRAPAGETESQIPNRKSEMVFFVRDNGVGFDMAYVEKLYGAFQRLHSQAEFKGAGVGLASVQRIIHRHGGQTWAEGAIDKGATFYFTLG